MPIRAFFASPFAPEYRWIRDAVAKACRHQSVELRAVDEVVLPGAYIINEIHREIEDADLAFAVISDLNPNVMYELGRILQASKPTILLADQSTFSHLPFDIRSFAVIAYDANARDIDGLSVTLEGALGKAKNALTLQGRNALVKDKSVTIGHRPPGATSWTAALLPYNFDRIKQDVEGNIGTSGCKTIEIKAVDSEGFKGWHQVLSCPNGDEVLIVIDLNGEVTRVRVK
jgi:nucleoside 2-deoxyribosyltransferase